MKPRVIITGKEFRVTIERLCYELIENHGDFSGTALIGLQPRGTLLLRRICRALTDTHGIVNPLTGEIDITFYRDDFRRREMPLLPQSTNMNFVVESKRVILMDDVLFTGRTVRAGLDALLTFGRPEKVELLVLIDRRWSRQLPIQPDYTGKCVDTRVNQKVKVTWKESEGNDGVLLYEDIEGE
ncbi:MAG: bifunctional pyr operon transcriptional regulator/uracil phosphoribosyltransferase PyrR [Bacteroidetes bacterium]|nr:bifunctional pyr operon transcriptional regulator/uracil phosphoribosyltransferase PyrR [Bacteroidota bacterium]